MSTKIFNGYRIRLDGRPRGLFDVVDSLRELWQPIGEEVWFHRLIEVAVQIFDGSRDPERKPEDGTRTSPLIEASVIEAREYHARTVGDGPNDLQATVCFLSDTMGAPADEEVLIYALLFVRHDRFRGAFEGLSGVEPWPYWDSTDRPSKVPEEEWAHRRAVWGRLLGYDAPAERGVSFELCRDNFARGVYRLREPGELERHLPTDEQRARWLATRQAGKERRERNAELAKAHRLGELLKEHRARVEELVPTFLGQLQPLARELLVGTAK